MTLKDVMDPIEWFEYASDRVERGLSVEEVSPIEKTEKVKPREIDYKKMLDLIQYFEYISEKEMGR